MLSLWKAQQWWWRAVIQCETVKVGQETLVSAQTSWHSVCVLDVSEGPLKQQSNAFVSAVFSSTLNGWLCDDVRTMCLISNACWSLTHWIKGGEAGLAFRFDSYFTLTKWVLWRDREGGRVSEWLNTPSSAGMPGQLSMAGICTVFCHLSSRLMWRLLLCKGTSFSLKTPRHFAFIVFGFCANLGKHLKKIWIKLKSNFLLHLSVSMLRDDGFIKCAQQTLKHAD